MPEGKTINENPMRLECPDCGCIWSPNLGEQGRMPKGWKNCPKCR